MSYARVAAVKGYARVAHAWIQRLLEALQKAERQDFALMHCAYERSAVNS